MLAVVQVAGDALAHVGNCSRSKPVVLAAVQQAGFALKYASDELRGDREVVLAAVQQDGFALKYASDELRGDREVVLAALTDGERWFCQYASTAAIKQWLGMHVGAGDEHKLQDCSPEDLNAMCFEISRDRFDSGDGCVRMHEHIGKALYEKLTPPPPPPPSARPPQQSDKRERPFATAESEPKRQVSGETSQERSDSDDTQDTVLASQESIVEAEVAKPNAGDVVAAEVNGAATEAMWLTPI